MRFSQSDVNDYHNNGFTASLDVFMPEEVEVVREQLDAWQKAGQFPVQSEEQQNLHLRSFAFWQLVTSPRLLSVVRQIIGDDILLLGTKLRCKQPAESADRVFPWHQDVASWKINPPIAHSAWIAFDENTLDNGCLFVIPGSHKRGRVRSSPGPKNSLLRNNVVVPIDQIDLAQARPLTMKPNQVRFFDGCLFHASQPNLSNKPRCNLLVRFISPAIQCYGNYPAILVSGQDRYHHFAEITPPYETQALR